MHSIRKRFEHHHNELVEIIYGTTADPEGWRTLLHKLVDLLEGRSARLLFLDGTAESLNASFTANMDEGSVRQYADYYMNICPWRAGLRDKPTGQLYSSYLDLSHDQDLHRSEYYNDWARPQGIEHEMGGNVIATSDHTVQLQVQRSGESGHFTHEDAAVVNKLLPHMQRALELRRRLDEERRACEGMVEVAQRSSLPCILLNEKLEVIHMDDNVIPLLVGYPELRIMSRKVSITNNRLNGLLQRQLKGCAAATHGEWFHAGGCVRLQGAGSDLEIHVYPIYPSHKILYSKSGHQVVLFLNDSRARYTLNEHLIHESFGLSPTELRLAEAIFNGDTLDAFAKDNGTTLNTVRSQVKQLFAKTGIRRQAELPKRLLPYLLLR